MIPFNKPVCTGLELTYIEQAIQAGHISGNGTFTKRCHELLKSKFGFPEVLLTPSCTAALEIAAMLCEFRKGDEVILPSFAHAGTANAFVRAGARVVFADSLPHHPNIDPVSLERLLGPNTRAIVAIHYAGMACEIKRLKEIALSRGLILIEDSAHALDARYMDKHLGSWGDLAAVSFHETKNINCGTGGMLILNRPEMIERATQIWNQGTNRRDFENGQVSFYTWVRPGGSFQLSDLNAAFLYPQLLKLEDITSRRLNLWRLYYDQLKPLAARGYFELPRIPEHAQHNAHIFYLLLKSKALRNQLIQYLSDHGYQAVFHYIPLHTSPFAEHNDGELSLPNCEKIGDTIVRLPLFDSLSTQTVMDIVQTCKNWQESQPVEE
jgi:dTDP-4-amino-4,6-dideoxygalactose transaminase